MKIKPAIRELLCQVCELEYQRWYVESDLWNLVANGNDELHFLCANCFMDSAQKLIKKKVVWNLRIPLR